MKNKIYPCNDCISFHECFIPEGEYACFEHKNGEIKDSLDEISNLLARILNERILYYGINALNRAKR